MNVLIVEDEFHASERLSELVSHCDQNINIIDRLDTVEDTVNFFKEGNVVDLLFLDIQLSDGKSFEIFDQINLDTPVIFTTAFDQFTLNAFKVNSIDYLLKPINSGELKDALDKFKRVWQKNSNSSPINYQILKDVIKDATTGFKKRFLVKFGNRIQFKTVENISHVVADGKTIYIISNENGRKYIIDHTLEELENQLLNPSDFFRINRKFIVRIDAISDVKSYFNSRLKLILNTPCEYDLIVSRDRVSDFKDWLNQ
ncbi:MAG: LytTR family DNA-binding domain-containing protein [Flammeovirgaceae bacterium]|nr:LytTR family DNA-binding domain-containing protein [Flammeovirgaceae bacterium]